jgi:histidinol-phosphate aminotransferase
MAKASPAEHGQAILPMVSPAGRRLRADVLAEPVLCGNGVALSRGSAGDVAWLAPIVSREIKAKRGITAEKILERCASGATFIAAKRGGEGIGGTIVVYEGDRAYLWLGAYSEKGNGTGSLSAKLAMQEAFALGYGKISTKTGEGNAAALSLLRKLGFEVSGSKGGVLDLERTLELNMAKNTLPWTPSCVQEAMASLARMQCCEYHDLSSEAKGRIASSLGVLPENVRLSANGNDSIRLALSLAQGCAIAVLCPTYPPIEKCAHEAGVALPLSEREVLEGRIGWLEGKAVVLCNPNNPTGTLLPTEAVEGIARIARLVIIDESYMHLAGNWAARLVQSCPVIVLRTLTKLGSAVAQLGMLLGNESLLSHLPQWSEPSPAGIRVACSVFTPDGMAEISGIAQEIAAQRERMARGLGGTWKMVGRPSANFMLFEERSGEAAGLGERGIMAKRLEIGGRPYFRLTVRSDWEVGLLLMAAREMAKRNEEVIACAASCRWGTSRPPAPSSFFSAPPSRGAPPLSA